LSFNQRLIVGMLCMFCLLVCGDFFTSSQICLLVNYLWLACWYLVILSWIVDLLTTLSFLLKDIPAGILFRICIRPEGSFIDALHFRHLHVLARPPSSITSTLLPKIISIHLCIVKSQNVCLILPNNNWKKSSSLSPDSAFIRDTESHEPCLLQ